MTDKVRPEMAMAQWRFERRAISLGILVGFGIEHGVPARDLLAGTGIAEYQLADPACTVSGRQELRLMENLVDRLGDAPALGIEAGRRYHFTAFGALGLAFASSPTLRSALDIGQRFSELAFGFARLLVEETARDVRVTIDDSQVPEKLRRFVVECTTAVMLTVARDLTGSDLSLLQVGFGFSRSTSTAPYECFLGVKPAFTASASRLTLDRATLERPLLLANAQVLRLSEQECQRLLERGRLRTGWTAKVRDRLEARIGPTDMHEVAADLHLTERTLRRRLQDEGTSFIALRDEVRMGRADELLAGPRLPIAEIAERLGYANATSFVNAFKRCRGRTPGNVRSAKRDRDEKQDGAGSSLGA